MLVAQVQQAFVCHPSPPKTTALQGPQQTRARAFLLTPRSKQQSLQAYIRFVVSILVWGSGSESLTNKYSQVEYLHPKCLGQVMEGHACRLQIQSLQRPRPLVQVVWTRAWPATFGCLSLEFLRRRGRLFATRLLLVQLISRISSVANQKIEGAK